MDTDQHHHLTYDDQLKAMVDMADLTDGQRAHLNGCQSCRHQVAQLERRYSRLGETARTVAPEPRRPFRMPRSEIHPSRKRFKTVWVPGVAAAMLFVALFWWPQRFTPEQDTPQFVGRGVENDHQFMAEVDALIENALPKQLRELAAAVDPIAEFELDEDLINWIVPSIETETREEDSLS
jgi:predicted anti-sigma-YlaC factor YlaD